MRPALCRRVIGCGSRAVLPRRWVGGTCSDVKVNNSLINEDGDSIVTKLHTGHPLTWYSCGPTVYDSSHMGHARTYVCTDVIRRILSHYHNVPMSYAMGITDIDDKIINKAVTLNYTTWTEVQTMVRSLENDFFRDMDRLNVLRPDHVLRVTEHVDAILSYISKLVSNGNAYVTSDGVYFDYSSLANAYDKFGCTNIPDTEPEDGSVTDPHDNVLHYANSAMTHQKRHPKDFALWKLHRKGPESDTTPSFTWDSPWGAGRPGWHIECSAMTHQLFGKHLDIHSGGVDLKFPHHTNEIAQCEAHDCSEHNGWVKVWIHLGHLHIEGRKMSKSLKNFISIDDYLGAQLTAQPADDFRIYCMQHKYNATLTYSTARVEEAAKLRSKFESFFASTKAVLSSQSGLHPSPGGIERKRKPTAESQKLSALVQQTQKDVHAALSDDFNTPAVLNALSTLAGESVQYIALLLTPVEATGQAGAAQVFDHPLEPLLASAAYIIRILTMLGLRFPANHALDAASMIASATINSAQADITASQQQGVSDASIEAVVQFRSTVREAALQGVKALRVKKKGGIELTETELQLEAQLQAVLGACDASRESLRSTLGIKVEDLGAICKWTRV